MKMKMEKKKPRSSNSDMERKRSKYGTIPDEMSESALERKAKARCG